ncbi:transcriptional regulator [Campylobacter coli]|nr:transcriptional regulator [Campylobacter coli]
MTKKSKRDMAYELDIDVSTLYNWRKYKPNLYRIVMLGFKFDELLENSKKTHEELLHIEQTIQDEIAKFKENPLLSFFLYNYHFY